MVTLYNKQVSQSNGLKSTPSPEAQKILKAGPQKDPRTQNWLSDLVSTATEPLRYLSSIPESISYILDDAQGKNFNKATEQDTKDYLDFAKTQPIGKAPSFQEWQQSKGKEVAQTYKPSFLTQEDIKNAETKPLETVLKNTATAGSYLIPGGSSLKTAIASGAGTGALGNFASALQSGDKTGEDILGETLKGAGFGAVGGGALYGVGKLAGKAFGKSGNKVAQETTEGLAKEPNKLSKKFTQMAEDAGDSALIKQVGVKPKNSAIIDNFKRTQNIKTYNTTLDGVDKLIVDTLNNEGNQLKSLIANNKTAIINADDIIKPALEKAKLIPIPSDRQKFIRAIDDIKKGIGNGQMTLEQANNMRMAIGAKEAQVYQSIARGGNLADRPLQEGYLSMYEQLKNSIDKKLIESGTDPATIKLLNDKVGSALEMRKYITLGEKTAKPEAALQAFDAMMIGGSAVNPMTLAPLVAKKLLTTSAAQRVGGKAFNKLSDFVDNGVNVGGLADRTMNPTIESLLPMASKIGALANVSQSNQPTLPQPTTESIDGLSLDDVLQQAQQPQQTQQTLSLAEALQIAQQYGAETPNERLGLAKALMEEANKSTAPVKKTEFQNKLQAAATAAIDAYNILEGGGVDLGKIAGLVTQPFAEFTGTQSAENVNYRSSVALARTMARNAMLGANMSDSELKSVEKFIPEYTDEPNIAKLKLANFIRQLQSISGAASMPDELSNLTGF
jgi:hypothetical protein